MSFLTRLVVITKLGALHFRRAFIELAPFAHNLRVGFPGVFMRTRLSPWVGLCAAVFLLGALSACGHEQQLVSITLTPATETFGSTKTPLDLDRTLSVQLRALGSYIHPPVTKDITNQVTWASDTPGMVTVNSTGLITPTGLACGNTIITATVTTNHSDGNVSSKGALVTASMQANVICFTGQ